MDLDVTRLVCHLAHPRELHDRIIAASAILRGVPVVTRDRQIRMVCNTIW